MIKISVIIPVYNAEQYIEECLQHIIEQELKEIEVICIDDGSIDNSKEIIKRYSKKDSRILYLYQNNKGSGKSRNWGISVAKGKYVCFMDADDWYPDKTTLLKLYKAAEKNNVQICGGSFSRYKNGEIITDFKDEYKGYTFERNEIIYFKDYQWDYGYHRFIYNREFLNVNNIFFPDYLRYQDPPFFLRAMVTAEKFYAISDVVYRYRVGHQTIKWNKRKTEDLLKGLHDNLHMAIDNNLDKICEYTINRINKDFSKQIKTELDNNNQKVFSLLMNINTMLYDYDQGKREIYIDSLQKVLSYYNMQNKTDDRSVVSREEYDLIYNSKSFKIGRCITFPLRLLRKYGKTDFVKETKG